jgi:hypothetical protein
MLRNAVRAQTRESLILTRAIRGYWLRSPLLVVFAHLRGLKDYLLAFILRDSFFNPETRKVARGHVRNY